MLKRLHLALIVLLVLMILFSTALFFISGSSAASKVGKGSTHHLATLPTRYQAHQRLTATTALGAAQGSGDLVWNNGPVEGQPRAYLIFWGAAWNNGSGGLTPDAIIAENYFSDVGTTPYANILTQYYDSHNHIAVNLGVGGFWADFSNPPTDSSCNNSPTVEDSDIQNEINKAISANGWPRDLNNSTYFVYTPSNDFVSEGASSGFCSEAQFCAYHGLSFQAGVPYAAIPYPSNLATCGVPTSPNNNPAGDSLANLSAAEQFDTITDPQQTAWIDSAGFEIADKCAFDFSGGPTHLNNSGVFELQTEYSNSDHACVNSYTYLQSNPQGISITTPPATNAGAKTFALHNTGSASIPWSAGTLPAWVSVSPTSGTVSANGTQTLTLTFNTAAPQQVYSTTLTINTSGANGPISLPIMVIQAAVSKTWYFAEGFTGSGFSEYLTLANPNSTQANVQVQYLLGSSAPMTKTYAVAPTSRYTILVNNEVGPNQSVSMVVTSDQPIIAERPMYFTFTGLSGYTIPGGSDVLGATQLAQQFDFGYLDTTPGHATFLTILNQNSSALNVTINYFPAAGGTPIILTHQVPANSRGTVNINQEAGLAPGSYSALVTLDQSGLVERPMYLKDSTTGFTGSADVVGVATPQQNWYFAEGFTASTFSERYILSNPGTSATAHATVTFFRSDGTTATAAVTLTPGAQQVVDANNVLGLNVNNSARVQADQPILAERFISFKYTGQVGSGGTGSIPGASDVLGAGAPSNLFYFAEGFTGNLFGEYLTIENPNVGSTATVIITFLPAAGSAPIAKVYQLPSGRFTLFTNNVMVGQPFSMVVTSTLPIVAERPMYFNFNNGQTGGSDVIGYQP